MIPTEHWTAIEARNKRDEIARKKEREKVLEIVNWHIATAKQEYEIGIERDGGRWVGSNRTDYPKGKLDALTVLKAELWESKEG